VVAVFKGARNPEADSTLPFVISVPLASGELVLKAKDVWPRTSKVYCHRAEEWPAEAEVLEEVAVRSCVRRGVAVDLVLDRARERLLALPHSLRRLHSLVDPVSKVRGHYS
jgi:hypothetical protein